MGGLLNLEILDALRALDEPGSSAFLSEIVTAFVADGAARFNALHEALAKGDHAEVARISHAMKGGSMNVGAESLASMMQAIENDSKAGRLCGAEELSAAETLFRRVSQALLAYQG